VFTLPVMVDGTQLPMNVLRWCLNKTLGSLYKGNKSRVQLWKKVNTIWETETHSSNLKRNKVGAEPETQSSNLKRKKVEAEPETQSSNLKRKKVEAEPETQSSTLKRKKVGAEPVTPLFLWQIESVVKGISVAIQDLLQNGTLINTKQFESILNFHTDSTAASLLYDLMYKMCTKLWYLSRMTCGTSSFTSISNGNRRPSSHIPVPSEIETYVKWNGQFDNFCNAPVMPTVRVDGMATPNNGSDWHIVTIKGDVVLKFKYKSVKDFTQQTVTLSDLATCEHYQVSLQKKVVAGTKLPRVLADMVFTYLGY
jgi:hypothetical protein